MSISTEYILFICGIPKDLSWRKLRALIGRQIPVSAWQLEQLIPLEQADMAQVTCDTREVYERFLTIDISPPFWKRHHRIYALPANALQAQSPTIVASATPSLLSLPHDCLLLICARYCTLKEQIALAKVCQYLQAVIGDIWRWRYKTLYYSLYYFEFKQGLSAAEVRDFCVVTGAHVQQLRYNSIFYFPIMQRHLRNRRGNMLQNAKQHINAHLCRNLEYFGNLRCFEVEGKFLADFTVRELARHCPDLRAFRLLDADTRWLRGKYLQQLVHLEQLSLRDCKNLKRQHLRAVCARAPLHQLDIVECKLLQCGKYLTRLCLSEQLASLNTLQLSAIADAKMLATILQQLRQLRHLQFYWHNEFTVFEQLLFSALLQHKITTLVGLDMRNEREFIDNESHERLSAYEYAAMREKVVLRGRPWTWRAEFQHWSRILQEFDNLASITCEYCRLFAPEQLLELPKVCRNLQNIKLIGCRVAEDAQLLVNWPMAKCRLEIEGLITAQDLEQMREVIEKMPYYRATVYAPLLRSIQCHF